MRLRTFLLVWASAVSLLVSGCLKPMVSAPVGAAAAMPSLAAQVIPSLSGRVEHHAYRAQATFGDIASGATVSLIDTLTNITSASTITTADGTFALTNLKITPGRIYYLEATKGLPLGGEPNRAGNPAARVRSIVQYNSTAGWASLSGPTITIDDGTTALSVIMSLRSATPPRPDEAALLGSLQVPADASPDVFTPGSSNVSVSEYNQVLGFVNAALGTDNDPLAVITYDTASQNYYLAQKGIQITGVNPVQGTIGTNVRIEGSGLSNTPIVRFNGVQAAASVNGIQTVLLTQVPPGATSGPLTVQVGTLVYNGTQFAIQNWDGHNVFDKASNLYVAGYQDNALWRFAPDGTVTLAASSSLFNNPRGVVVDPWDNVYVTSWNGNKIFQVRPDGSITEYASGGGLNRPWGLAMNPAGDLFVANYNSHNVLKIATGSALPLTPTIYPTSGLSYPSRLAFDLAGYLYVSNWGNGTVSRVAPDGTTDTLAAGMNNPGGVALDSRGNVFVGAQGNSAVYKITPAGQLSTFAALPSYDDSVAFHPDGTLYVAGYGYPYVARLDGTGRVLGYFSPGHLPYSLAADSARNLYVTSGQGWGGNSGIVSKATWNSTKGAYEPLQTLIKDLPNPSALAFEPGGDLYIGDWSGLLFRANPTTGNYTSVKAGLGAIGDLAVSPTGKVYAASWGNHSVYQLTNNAITKSWGTYLHMGMMAKGPDGAYYIPDHSWNQILRLKDGTMSVYKTYGFGNPMGVAFDPDGNLYVSGWNNNAIYKVATGSLAVSTYKTGIGHPGAMEVDAGGNLYVTDWDASKVRRIAPDASKTMTDYAVIPSNCRGMVRDALTGDLYVGGWNDQTIYKVDGGTQAVTPVRQVGGAIWGLSRDATTGDLYAACYGNSTVVRVSADGGTTTVLTSGLTNPCGILRDGTQTILSRWDAGVGIYAIEDGSSALRVIGQGFWNPSGILVDRLDERYVYVSDWNVGALVKLDTVADTWTVVADSGDWLRGRNVMKGMTWGPDNMLYVQNWGGGTYQLDMSQVNRFNGAGVSFYGGNAGGMGILGGIAFGANGVLYGTSYDWMRNGSSVVVGLPPGGLASGVGGIRMDLWPNSPSF